MDKWCSLRNSNNWRSVKSILLDEKPLGLVEMTSGLVNASFSLPEWQAVKMIFFAPCQRLFNPFYHVICWLHTTITPRNYQKTYTIFLVSLVLNHWLDFLIKEAQLNVAHSIFFYPFRLFKFSQIWTSLMQVNGFYIVAETLLWGRGMRVCMSHNVVVLLNYKE